MTGPIHDHFVSIGGRFLDPLAAQVRQLEDDEPVVPSGPAGWLVQFWNLLDAATIQLLRSQFGLRLTDYVPPRSYVESLDASTATQLRADSRVRAVVMLTADLKLSAALAAALATDEPLSAAPVDAVVFDATADATVERIRDIVGTGFITVLDDRDLGGALSVRVQADPETAARLAALDGVRWVAQVPGIVDDAPAASVPIPGRVPAADALGLSGVSQIIGIIDNGPPDVKHCFFVDPGQPQPGPTHRKIVMLRDVAQTAAASHPTFTCGIAAGDQVDESGANPFRGVAWLARLACGNYSDLKTSSVLAELTAAAQAGASVHTNSWHSVPNPPLPGVPAPYDQTSVDVDTFVWSNEDNVVLGSGGNTGEQQGAPGTAKNALCIGATTTTPGSGDVVGDGATGPTADGRRKPDLTGVGCGVQSALLGTTCGVGVGASSQPCATSYATPWVAGLVTLLRQQFTEGRYRDGQPSADLAFTPTAALLRAAVLNATVVTGTDNAIPSFVRGWGALDPDSALGRRFPRLLLDVRNQDGLSTTDTCHVTFTLAEGPLVVTLNWTEPPGTLESDNCVVNDLDLRVTTPKGDVFLGNNFSQGVSVTGGTADALNSTEMVVLPGGAPGQWLVEVVASEVNVGAPGQGFAVVVSGSVATDPAPQVDGGRTLLRTEVVSTTGAS
jgi:hypothetical protein